MAVICTFLAIIQPITVPTMRGYKDKTQIAQVIAVGIGVQKMVAKWQGSYQQQR